MLNKQFNALIKSVTLHAGNEGEKSTMHGATVQCEVPLKDPAFIEDIGFGTKLKGLKALINGDIPVDGSVALKYSHKSYAFYMEGFTVPEASELMEVKVAPGDEVNATVLRFKMKMSKISSKNWGVVSTALKETLKVKLIKAQEELPLEDQKKDEEDKE